MRLKLDVQSIEECRCKFLMNQTNYMNNKQFLEILLDENKEMSEKIKRMEELASQMEQSNQRYLSELKRTDIKVDRSGVNQSIGELERVAEKTKKAIENTQKRFNVVLYSVVFCAIGLASLFFAFRFGFQAKSEIRNEYYNELNNENRILSKDDALFIQKFRKWHWKNPKDNKK